MRPALRVLHYIDTENFAGTERHILELAAAQKAQGVHVKIACPKDSALAVQARTAQLPMVFIEGENAFNANAVRTLRRLLRSQAFDILHAHNGRTALSCTLAAKLARRGRCIATQHFIDPARLARSGPKALLFNMVHHWVNGAVHHFIANSNAARDAMLERGDAPPDKISVTPLGISPPENSHIATSDALRQELAIAPEAPLVVCVARLEKEKDVSTLVAAMQRVVSEIPQAICLHAGEGAERPIILQQIRDAGIETNMRLLGFRDDVLSLIGAADVFVLPSIAEPFGLVLLEAMAMRKAVIATRAGGPREIVIEGETGILVTPAAPHEMADAIIRLLKNRELCENMGQNGYARFLQQFTTQHMAQSTLAAYGKVL
jgi:glycosyltransferase involved in cell wall biosynthesis